MIKGIVIPVITPFEHDGSVDEPMLRKLVDFYVEAGVQGLYPRIQRRAKRVGAQIFFGDEAGVRSDFHSWREHHLRSSGQGPAMSMAERKRTAEIAVELNPERRAHPADRARGTADADCPG